MGAEKQITVTLKPELEAFIVEEVERGKFTSISAYIRAVLQERLNETRHARLGELDKALDRGIADADAGRVKSIMETFDDLRTALRLDQHSR